MPFIKKCNVTIMLDLAKLCQQCLPIINQTGDFIRQELGAVNNQSIETKSLNSLVSYVDKTAEKMLVEKLQVLTPTATFLTEEETIDNQKSELRWIIDPLDGTTNFLHGVPVFAISVALEQNGVLVLGLIQEVNRQENFYAWKGGGAYLNGRAIHVSQKNQLADSLLATGFPYYDFSKMTTYLQVLESFMRGTRGLRRMGAAAIDLAFVACGRFDGFFEYGINTWDVAAGIIIIEEAGGRVSDFKSGDLHRTGQEVLATNGLLHDAMLEKVQILRKSTT
jgi:myo-inositol-1(or 4)-monophosphatase